MGRIRILHAPTDVGGNPQGLARAERKLDFESDSIVFADTFFLYPGKRILFRQGDGFFMREMRRFTFFIFALFHYKVFHFNFGQTIFPSEYSDVTTKWNPPLFGGALRKLRKLYARLLSLRDLPLLHLLGKRIFITFQGDDARQAQYCREHFPVHFVYDVPPEYYPAWLERRKPKRIEKFTKYAHKIYAVNPDLLWILPARAEFLPYSHIDLNDWRPAARKTAGPIRIIHAPSDRNAKGTKYLLQALSLLRNRGYKFQFTLVEGVSNQEARKLYEEADLLVDQLLAGWYGGLAVELMALAKPVICYIRSADLVHIPAPMRTELPLINAEPSNIYDVLRRMLKMSRKELHDIGKRSRKYVENWHDPDKIARRLTEDYLNFDL